VAKIDPALASGVERGEVERFVVVLREQADLSGAERLPTKREKTRYVFDRLRETAQRTQPAVHEVLRREGFVVRSFYIANELLAESPSGRKVREEALHAVASRPDVARLTLVGKAFLPEAWPSEGPPATASFPLEEAFTEAQVWNWNVAAIGAQELHAAGSTGQGIVVGIADSGAQADHPALRRNYRGRLEGDDYNWFDPSSDASPTPVDANGHGTHVTGTAVGTTAERVIGVAPGARWIGCRALGPEASRETILACLQWFLAPTDRAGRNPDPDRSPDVTNHSYICPFCELETAFSSLRAAGIFAAVASANFGPACGSVFSPGDYPMVTTVGATEAGRHSPIAEFSSRGPIDGGPVKPNLVAPGTAILSALPSGTYGRLSGTSMATPHLTGAVALLWSHRPDLRGRVNETRRLLFESAFHRQDKAGCSTSLSTPNHTFGFGFLDVAKAACGTAGCAPRTLPAS
jgi:subtilisin family serine protease